MGDKNSRTKNAKLNILYGYIAQIGILVFSFIGRKLFLCFLSAEYLGINGLYTNILTILSLPELGLDAAVVYSLYKPVAEQDIKLIHSLVIYFKRIYSILAVVILAIGISLVPFLKFLITSDLPLQELKLYYFLFLINTVISYFVAHKIALLSASQEQRIQKLVMLSFNLVLQILHIAILVIWGNYCIYIVGTIITTTLTNICLGIITERLHSDVFKETSVVSFEKKPIIDRIYSTFLYKIGTVLINSTDNILISVLVSTIAVGYYANYCTVVTAVTGFIAIINTSLLSGIGNLAVKGTKDDQSNLFDMMILFYHLVSAIGLIGFSLLFNNLITVWLGSEYLFEKKTVLIIAFNFYLTNFVSPVWMFREANGLFNKVKYLLLIRAALNILFSILFGKLWGVFGILLATAVSLLFTNFWFEPYLLSKYVFQRYQRLYWIKQGKYFLITIVCFIFCYYAIRCMCDTLLMLILKALIICCISSVIFVITNIRTPEFKRLKNYILRK